MVVVTLYFVAFTIQMLAIIAVIVSSSWELANLVSSGFIPTPSWTPFFCLLALACLSMVIPLIQLILHGRRYFPNESMSREDRHLSARHYRSQAIILGILSLLWLLASGYSTAVLILGGLTDQFGSVTYIGIAASWTTALLSIFMMIFVIHIQRSRSTQQTTYGEVDVKQEAGL